MDEQSNDDEFPDDHQIIVEGKAWIIAKGNAVFYNKAQVVNRDLSVAVLRWFAQVRIKELQDPKFQSDKSHKLQPAKGPHSISRPANLDGLYILEALSASGLRSIRYALEVPHIARIDACELDETGIATLATNVEFNGKAASEIIHPVHDDARHLMLISPKVYDVIDLDPYGSPTWFLDTAVQAIADGGLLIVTATDTAVLCGNSMEACWEKYRSYPLHKAYCHEQAIRTLLASIESAANRYKKHIVPVLSMSIDFYIRVFVRVYTSALVAKSSGLKLSYVWQSTGCDAYHFQPVGTPKKKGDTIKIGPGRGPNVPKVCPHSGQAFVMGGPIWTAPIHDKRSVKQIHAILTRRRAVFAQYPKLHGLLIVLQDELPDIPLYFDHHALCSTAKLSPMSLEKFRSALLNAGYRVSGSHCSSTAVKTDAPWEFVWDVLRAWQMETGHVVKGTAEKGSFLDMIVNGEQKAEVNFNRAKGASVHKMDDKRRVARFVQNPANWGPLRRHGKQAIDFDKVKKRKREEEEGEEEGEEGEEGEEEGGEEVAEEGGVQVC